MATITHTQLDPRGVFISADESIDGVLAHGVAETVARGTILARNTTTGQLGVYASAGINGLNIPKYVLQHDVTHPGAGTVAVRALSAGEVWKSKLIVHADGDDTNVNYGVLEALRPTIIARLSTELAAVDNV